MNIPENRTIKIVLIGDTGTGKTCLITNYLYGTFNDEHVPNVLDFYTGNITFKDKSYEMEIFDTSGDN